MSMQHDKPYPHGSPDFDIERFVPAFNEASIVSLSDASIVEILDDPTDERKLYRGIRAVIEASVACDPIELEVPSSIYYVNNYGDVTASENIGGFLNHKNSRLKQTGGYRFVSHGIKPKITDPVPSGYEIDDKPTSAPGVTYFDMDMGEGSALITANESKDVTVNRGFEIGELAVLSVRGPIARNVHIGSDSVVAVRRIKKNFMHFDPGTTIKAGGLSGASIAN